MVAISVMSRLTTAAELDAYADHYASASGYRVPLEYLRRSAVYGFRRGDRLIGGVVMCAAGPLRTIDRLPAPHRDAVVRRLPVGGVVELTCVWIEPALRRGAASALFWFGLFLETSRHGVGHVLFGTESSGLRRLYLCGRPEVVYDGPVTVDGIDQHGWIFLSSVRHRWPALVRMTCHKALRPVRRRVRAPATGGPR